MKALNKACFLIFLLPLLLIVIGVSKLIPITGYEVVIFGALGLLLLGLAFLVPSVGLILFLPFLIVAAFIAGFFEKPKKKKT